MCNKTTGPRSERRRTVISNNELWNIQAPARSWNAINRSGAGILRLWLPLYPRARFPVTRLSPSLRRTLVECWNPRNAITYFEGWKAERGCCRLRLRLYRMRIHSRTVSHESLRASANFEYPRADIRWYQNYGWKSTGEHFSFLEIKSRGLWYKVY